MVGKMNKKQLCSWIFSMSLYFALVLGVYEYWKRTNNFIVTMILSCLCFMFVSVLWYFSVEIKEK